MISEYKHKCIIQGKVHYACIRVEIKLNTSSSKFTRIAVDCHKDDIPINWLSSAVDGLIEAADRIMGLGLYQNLIIRLKSVAGDEDSTSQEIIRATASNAIWKALIPGNTSLKLAFVSQ